MSVGPWSMPSEPTTSITSRRTGSAARRYSVGLCLRAGKVDRDQGCSVSVSAAPSSAPSARSTEHEMHVKVGVSRSV
jgi:hypothetical protein